MAVLDIDGDRPALDTRLRIEREAIQLFADKGFPSSTMREIMRACDLTSGAFYNHFESKDQLLFTIIVEAHDDLDLVLQQARVGNVGSPVNYLRAVTNAFAKWHCLNDKRARVVNGEYRSLTDNMYTEVVVRRRQLRSIFEQIVSDGRDQGLFSIDPDVRAPRFWAISIVEMLVAIADWFNDAGPWSADEVGVMYEEAVLRMMRASE
jgi:AcrR family transcriptional regulator